jgi:4-hydroxy-3-methylbut-2-enyl diphosphate reductase
VVEDLKAKGAVFVEEIDQVPDNAHVVFSAHGVARSVVQAAAARTLPVLDATCPLVSKVHAQAKRYVRHGRTIILIGHAGHPEVEGTIGQIDAPVHLISTAREVATLDLAVDAPLAYVTQTTLSVDDTKAVIEALRGRFSNIVGPDTSDICYATQHRQQAVRQMARMADVILVVGAQNSSNSNRLCEIGKEEGVPSYLIDDASALDPKWLEGKEAIGLTAGASAPEALIDEVIEALKKLGPVTVEPMDGVKEDIEFRLPAELRPRPARPTTEAPAFIKTPIGA